MTAGSQAQGSWGNMKGDKAEVVVKELIERKLKERGLIIEETSHGKSKTLKLNDGRILIFGTEPDIGIYESTISTMVIQIAIEIKGGIDPAAALERFGASLKSLRRAKQDNINSITILIMQNVSLTSKAQDEIKSSFMTIDYLFTIDDLISNEESMDRLFKVIKI